MSGRVDAQKEVVKERVGGDRCNVQVLCFQSCSVCRFIPVEFPAPLDNMVQCDVTIARGNVSFTPDALIDCAYVEKVLVKARSRMQTLMADVQIQSLLILENCT